MEITRSFALILTAILGFCALALDYSRIVISEIQLQNTADAAALAATTILRDKDGDTTRARKSAEYVISQNFVAEKRGGISPEISFGKWDWSQPSSMAWAQVAGTQSPTAVWVRVERDSDSQNEGVPLWLAPALGGPERADVSATAMAAYRARETMIVLDVTRGSQYAMSEIRNGLTYYLDYLAALRVQGDQLGLVAFAGEAVMVTPMEDIDTDYSGKHRATWAGTASASIDVCRREGFNEWYYFDRYYGYAGTNIGTTPYMKTYPERVDYFYPTNWEQGSQTAVHTYNAMYWDALTRATKINEAGLSGTGTFHVSVGGKKATVDCSSNTTSCAFYASYSLWKKAVGDLVAPLEPFLPVNSTMPKCRTGTGLVDTVEWSKAEACIQGEDLFSNGCPRPAYYDAGRKASKGIQFALGEFRRYTTRQQSLKHMIVITSGLPECTFPTGMEEPASTGLAHPIRDKCTMTEQSEVEKLVKQGFDADAISVSVISINMTSNPAQSKFWRSVVQGQGEFYETNVPSDIKIALDDLVKKVPVVLVQ